MKGRMQTVTDHGSTFCEVTLLEECPECKSSKTDLRMEANAQQQRYHECRACGCKWFSTPQPSARAKPKRA